MQCRKVISGLCAIILYVTILSCYVYAQPQGSDIDIKEQVAVANTLEHYVQLRLRDAHWQEYAKLVTWTDEPAWDCKWVTSRYRLEPAKKHEEKVVVPVVYERIGLLCNDLEFEVKPEVVIVNYELILQPDGWRVNGPDIDYPNISAAAAIRSLNSVAENLNETSVRRTKARTTARKVADVLNSRKAE